MRITILLSLLLGSVPLLAQEKIFRIYQDADLSNHRESSWAIQKGIEVAFSEIDYQIQGHKVEFKYLDHRGNVVRSKKNYETFLQDDLALAIFSGIHSPPLITNRTFINENDALTLVPWAAGSPVTRHPSSENWIFRLSIDDIKAGPVLVDFAITDKNCSTPLLLLEDSPWGDSNLQSMSLALKRNHIEDFEVARFGWNIGTQGARILVREARDKGSDCIILVANAIEGAVIAQAMIDQSIQIPIVSHWGITGGNFHKRIGPRQREKLDISFIQTCFAFTNLDQPPLAQEVFRQLNDVSKGLVTKPVDLESAVGFIHAYDLTKLFIAAIEQTGLTGNLAKDRNSIRIALENLESPIHGLVKTYQRPFSVFSTFNNIDAHEALDQTDYCMAKFGESNEVLIVQNEKKGDSRSSVLAIDNSRE